MGLVWILKDSYILRAPRDFLKSKSVYLQELFSCSLCLGFWVGFMISTYSIFSSGKASLDFIILPFASSAFCWFFDSLLDLIHEGIVLCKDIRKK